MFASTVRLITVSYLTAGAVSLVLSVMGLGFPMALTFGFLAGMTAAGVVERRAQARFAQQYLSDLEARAPQEIKF